jgi:hypothetical protein
MATWHGTVNIGNIEEVASLIKALLTGKLFTTVHCYEYKRYEPEVRLHQRLEGGKGNENIVVIHHHKESDWEGAPFSQVIICDTYGVGGFSTNRIEGGYDPEFQSPYIIFERNQAIITTRAPNGMLYYAVWVIEGDIPEEQPR